MARDDKYTKRGAGRVYGKETGASIGQGVGMAMGGPVGGAVGRAVGGAAGQLVGTLGKKGGIGPGYRKYVKDMFQKAQEGKLVDDREKVGFERQAQQAAEQTLQAQVQAANQAAMAGGPVQAGLMKETAQQIARTGTGAQVKAKGAAEQFAASLEEKRRAEALNAANQLMQQDAKMDMIDEMRAQMDIEEAGALIRQGGQEKERAALREDQVRDAAFKATRGLASAIKGL